ncbi:hypothetical protein BJX76DRAFT_358793 [Aspergillus varians]
MAPATFPLFPLLPTEIRQQIWHESLPKPLDQTTLFPYKKGCWAPRYLTAADPDFDHDNPELAINLEFHHDRLNPLQVDPPLFHVNCEARSIALRWVHTQSDIQPRSCKDRQSLLFRQFDPARDALYVPEAQWDDFICEPALRPFELDLIDRNISYPSVPFTRLAMSERLLYAGPDIIPSLFYYFNGIQEIFLISKAYPGSADNDREEDYQIKLGGWWELETPATLGPSFYWDANQQDFQWGEMGTSMPRPEVCALLPQIGEELRPLLAFMSYERLDIRLAVAVRR